MPKLEDFTGRVCGCWQVIERDRNPKSKSHETFWKCKCQRCGNLASVRKTDLKKEPKSCNNCKGDIVRQTFEEKGVTKHPIHIGDKFGLLTIIDRADKEYRGEKGYWKCQCVCGNIVNIKVDHLLGRCHGRAISCGCSNISSGELKIKQLLEENNINFRYQYIIKDFNKYSAFDFAIFDDAENKLLKLIEFDGEQHFRAVEYFGGEEKFKLQKERDKRKDDYCKQNNIKLQRIPYYDYDKIDIDLLLS